MCRWQRVYFKRFPVEQSFCWWAMWISYRLWALDVCYRCVRFHGQFIPVLTSIGKDLISSGVVNTSRLTRVYRQQNESDIINAAHAINDGRVPHIDHCTKVEMIGQKDDAADASETEE